MKPMMFIRNLAKTFFPAFGIGTVFCLIQMWVSHRLFMSFGLMLVCIGMTLACANVEVWADAKMKGENKDAKSNQTHRKAA